MSTMNYKIVTRNWN